MKKIIFASIFILGLCLMLPAYAFTGENKEITIIQDGKTLLLKEEGLNKIVLKQKAFTLHFFNGLYTDDSSYALQIAIFGDMASLDKIKAGSVIEEVPFFAAGTGLAAYAYGYSSIFLDNEAHHYLMYKNKQDKRAELVAEKNGLLELEWRPHSFYLNNRDTEFAEAGIKEFYLVILNDRNLNGIVDPEELYKAVVTFQ